MTIGERTGDKHDRANREAGAGALCTAAREGLPRVKGQGPPEPKGVHKRRRLTAQDRGDIAEARRRLADRNEKPIPYDQLRKELGLV
jgi:hypothetical protein